MIVIIVLVAGAAVMLALIIGHKEKPAPERAIAVEEPKKSEPAKEPEVIGPVAAKVVELLEAGDFKTEIEGRTRVRTFALKRNLKAKLIRSRECWESSVFYGVSREESATLYVGGTAISFNGAERAAVDAVIQKAWDIEVARKKAKDDALVEKLLAYKPVKRT